jgi:xanthine/uracil/vitamin C permease (AzgA family)
MNTIDKVRGSIIVGIALVSICSWPRDTAITFFPRTAIGDSRFDFFKNVVGFHPIKKILVAQDWDLSKAGGQFVLAVFTMLYVDILDATGTLYSMARFSGVVDPVTGDFPKSTIAYSADAIAISIGSLFGSSPVTAFVESGVSTHIFSDDAFAYSIFRLVSKRVAAQVSLQSPLVSCSSSPSSSRQYSRPFLHGRQVELLS